MSNKNIILTHYGGIKAPYLPLGTLYIANSLQNQGYSPKLVPSNTSESKFESILSELKPLYVGFSVFTSPQISEMITLSKLTKQLGFNTVWGGYHPTVLAEQCLKEPFVDYVIRGEGDEISGIFTRQLAEGNLEKKTIFESARIINNLDEFKPALNLVNLKDYVTTIQPHLRKKYGTLNSLGYILTSRGCLSNCKFCGVHAIYKDSKKAIWNTHSSNFVHEQVTYIKSNIPELESIVIWDDNFFRSNLLEERSKKILEGLMDENLKFTIEARGTFLCDKENVKFLKNTGCLQVFIGAESGSQAVLNSMRKNTKVTDYLKAVENCLDEDLPIRLSFFYGYPGETLEDINKTKEFLGLLKNYGERVTISGPKMYRPVPGTEGFKEAVKLGFIPPEDTQGWARVNSNTDPTLLPWLINESKREGIKDNQIYEWLGIRMNS